MNSIQTESRAPGPRTKDLGAYVLVTAAFNEEAFIERTIQSVIQQTCLPARWVIVSDGSWDRTDQIVSEYASRFGFIELLRVEEKEKHVHNFGSKVRALNLGFERLKDLHYGFIGILDADVSFDSYYFALLMEQFAQNPLLGLAGGYICEEHEGIFESRMDNSVRSVAGAIQLFRRECHGVVRTFVPLEHGGEDWCAEIMAKMNGWEIEAFPDLKVFHHKPTGSGAPGLRHQYRQGLADFALGTYPLFEVFKCVRRLGKRPYVLGAFTRFSGFAWAYCTRQKRTAPAEVIEYLRSEQKTRLRHLLP